MPICFDRLGIWFKLFSPIFYTTSVRERLWGFLSTLRAGDMVMDLGGGTGVLIELAHKRRTDLKYLCVDPAMGMLRYAPRYAFRLVARAEELPFKQTITAVMIGDAIHHFRSPERAVEEICRCLKPGGRLFVFDINPAGLIGRAAVFLEKVFREPIQFFYPEQLRDLLIRKQFTVLSMNGNSRYTIEAVTSSDNRTATQ